MHIKEKYKRNNYSDLSTTGMQVVIMRSNYQELEKVIKFAKRYKLERVLLQPVNGNFDNKENIFFNADNAILQYSSCVIQEMKKEANEFGIKLIEWLSAVCCSNQDSPRREIDTKKVEDQKKNTLACCAPWQQMVIEWGGDVYPHCHCIQGDCSKESKKIGNVLEEGLTEIWNGEKMQFFRKKIVNNDLLDLCNPNCFSGLIPSDVRDVSLKI
jgi:MoaA/NifB/PqqE/SkfB family radical SAM enzyme